MIEAYVGPEAFRAAVRSYIRKYAYSNAAGEDFWNEVTRVTGKPVDRDHEELRRSARCPGDLRRHRVHGGNSEIALVTGTVHRLAGTCHGAATLDTARAAFDRQPAGRDAS